MSDPLVAPVVGGTPELSVDELWQWIEDAAYSEDPPPLGDFRKRVAQLKAALVSRPEPHAEPEVLKTVSVMGLDGNWKLAARFYDYGYFEKTMKALEAYETARPEPREPEPHVEALMDRAGEWQGQMFDREVSAGSLTSSEREAVDIIKELMLCVAHSTSTDAAVRPASAPSLENQHGSNRVQHDISVRPSAGATDVPLSDGGQVAASAPSRPLEEDRMRTVLALCFNRQITAEEALQRLRVLVPSGDPQEP